VVGEVKRRQNLRKGKLVELSRSLVDVGKTLPKRTCFICRQKANKSVLCRVVRTIEGTVSLDITGMEPGRGAYLCLTRECLGSTSIQLRLERALRTQIGIEDKELLVAQIKENMMRFKEIEP
jgi:hypothetical protein